MAKLSSILRSVEDNGLMWWCPGCDGAHMIRVQTSEANPTLGGVAHSDTPIWGWNGNLDRPTFTPSVLVRGTVPLTPIQYDVYKNGGALPEPTPLVCHSFVVDGRMQFLTDCTHALAGQTVDIPPFDEQ